MREYYFMETYYECDALNVGTQCSECDCDEEYHPNNFECRYCHKDNLCYDCYVVCACCFDRRLQYGLRPPCASTE